jgi:xanthine dehydrogenase accessory factor
LSIFDEASKLLNSRRAFVMVTMLSGKGHTPQDPGAKILVTSEGLAAGTVGGGKIEARAISHAQELLRKSPVDLNPQVITWNLQKDIGMSCGGEGTYLFEAHSPSNWKVVVFGAGHVSQALTRTLVTLDCSVTCIDPRREWVEKLPTDSKLSVLISEEPWQRVQNFDSNTFFVVMTQGHASDVPILKEIFGRFSAAPFIGVIGSDIKALKIKTELKAFGVSEELLNRLRCPMGLSLGSNQPSEIAISIAAELLQVRDRWFSFSRANSNEG